MIRNARSIKCVLTRGTYTLTTLALLVVAPDLVRADVVADPSACATIGTFASLEAAGSCTIGDKTYSDFTFQSSNVTAGNLNYRIIDTGLTANGFSFEIGNFFAVGTAAVDMTIGFNVTAPADTIESVNLTQVGATSNGGIASIGEVVCLDGSVVTCPAVDTRTLTTVSGGSLTGSLHFSPVEMISVTKNVSAIANGGFASISQIFETVDQVPEPSFYGLLAGGIALTLVRARRQKKTA